jgi:ABC-type Fe3+/spermidine/putrescine transport system ATPase subunit
MMLAGFVQPSEGRILRSEVDITALPPEQRGFGVVFQGYALFPHLTVAQNVAFPLRIRGLTKSEIDRRTQDTIDLMRLQPFANRLPRQLSGGQQQRVALARALVFNPPLLLLDEPMSALDRKLKEDLQAELKDLHKHVGTTFVHITHDQDEAMALADRIAIMQDGRIVQVGTPHELYRRPASRFVAGFLGKSNFIDGVVRHSDGSTLDIHIASIATVSAASTVRRADGQRITLAIRPEDVSVSARPAPGSRPSLPGTVTSAVFFGKHTAIHVDVPEVGPLVAYVGSDESVPAEGDAVFLSWSMERGVVVNE